MTDSATLFHNPEQPPQLYTPTSTATLVVISVSIAQIEADEN